MAASVFDSPLFAKLFATGDTGRLFSDSAAIRAMLLVEGALAKAQSRQGLIPEISAAAIHRATLEIQIDPGALARATGQNGVSVPGLVEAFRAEMNAPEHAQYVHWGATSQDIMDTALMLRMRQALLLAEADLRHILTSLADQAEQHAETPMTARTYGQHATATSWGAVVAAWGAPLLDALEALPELREGSLWVSLSGAAGTASELGHDPAALRTDLAEGLGLRDPGRTWHTDRGPVLRLCDWSGQITAALASLAQSITALAGSDIAEVRLSGAGASSTMPQKQNPVAASAILALAYQNAALRSGMTSAAAHQHQRDGAAWFTEWMLVPQIMLTLAAALHQAKALCEALTPDTQTMAATMQDSAGMIHAEALSFALAREIPRPEAQKATKSLCTEARAMGKSLEEIARAAHASLPAGLFDPRAQMGEAPKQARAFTARVRAL